MSIEQRVKQATADLLEINTSTIEVGNSFVDDLGADSLDQIELVMAMEAEFDIEIPDDDADAIKTVQQAIDYIARVTA